MKCEISLNFSNIMDNRQEAWNAVWVKKDEEDISHNDPEEQDHLIESEQEGEVPVEADENSP